MNIMNQTPAVQNEQTDTLGKVEDVEQGKSKKKKGGFGFIGKTIRDIREEKQMSQIDLATEAQITQAQLSNYENNNSLPSAEVLGRIINALEVEAILFAVKALSDFQVTDPRNQLRVDEYEPIIQETLTKINDARKRIHN